jgi:endoribonuclease Dicer
MCVCIYFILYALFLLFLQMKIAQDFQEMFLRIIFNRVEFSSDQISLGEVTSSIQYNNSTSYLLLPLKQHNYSENNSKFVVDWATMRHCLSSPIFGSANSFFWRSQVTNGNSVKMKDGQYKKCDVVGSLICTPHNGSYYFVDDILHEIYATSQLAGFTYAEYFKKK